MPNKLIFRVLLVVLLFVICLVAGIVGGIGFPPDVTAIRELERVRANSADLTKLAIVVTHVGSAYFTLGGGLAVSAWLAWSGRRRAALVLGATVLGERLIIDGLKLLINRDRPEFDIHPVATHISSFPSGHATNSMAVFLAIALIAVPRANRGPAVITAVALSLLIGATRPFLGVHWPSDVIGGWALGAALAIIGWFVAERARSTATK